MKVKKKIAIKDEPKINDFEDVAIDADLDNLIPKGTLSDKAKKANELFANSRVHA